jgi:protein TonB
MRIALFVLISVACHCLLLLVAFDPPAKKSVTPIEIARVTNPPPPAVVPDPPTPHQVREPETPPKPQESAPIKPPSPRRETAPQEQTRPEAPPSEPPPEVIPQTEEDVNVRRITPKTPDPDTPPAPMSVDEFMAEREELRNHVGPDRSIPDIARDFLRNQRTAPGEDAVSFNRMSYKYEAYFYAFSRSLYRQWKYPADAARRGEAGIVRINFSITREGKITNVLLLESSGYPALDREAIRALRSMDPVPLPEGSELDLLHVNGYFIYSLDGRYRVF